MNDGRDPLEDSCTAKEKVELMREFYRVSDRVSLLWIIVVGGLCGSVLLMVLYAVLRLVVFPDGTAAVH